MASLSGCSGQSRTLLLVLPVRFSSRRTHIPIHVRPGRSITWTTLRFLCGWQGLAGLYTAGQAGLVRIVSDFFASLSLLTADIGP